MYPAELVGLATVPMLWLSIETSRTERAVTGDGELWLYRNDSTTNSVVCRASNFSFKSSKIA